MPTLPILLEDIREAHTKPIYEQKTRLSNAQLATLKSELPNRIWEAEHDIFLYHDPADAIFFVVSGNVVNYEKLSDGRFMAFDRIGPGGFFGEVAALSDGYRTAAALALEKTELLVLNSGDIDAFLTKHPDIAKLMMRGMAERLNRSGKDLTHAPLRNLALTQTHKLSWKDCIIIAAGAFFGGNGFLLVFLLLMVFWGIANRWYRFDQNFL